MSTGFRCDNKINAALIKSESSESERGGGKKSELLYKQPPLRRVTSAAREKFLDSQWRELALNTTRTKRLAHSPRERQRVRERERLSACSAVFAGFHIIPCRSCPPTGKFSEIASFNYLLPTAATALAGWCCTGAWWDLEGGKKHGHWQPCTTFFCLLNCRTAPLWI